MIKKKICFNLSIDISSAREIKNLTVIIIINNMKLSIHWNNFIHKHLNVNLFAG